jgi:hypothetical protein
MTSIWGRRPRTVIGALGVALLLPLGMTAAATPAFAAACSGYTCHGIDPTGRCTSTSNLSRVVSVDDPLDPRTVAVLYNKYSKGCNANWAWAVLTPAGYDDGDSMIVVVTTTDSHGTSESMCYPGPNSTGKLNEYCYNSTYRGAAGAYTDMVDGTNLTRAYAYVYDFNGKLVASGEEDQ